MKQIISHDSRSKEIIKPILRGRDLHRYNYNYNNLYIIATFPSLNLDIDKYPGVKNHLQTFGKRLNQTGETFLLQKVKNKKVARKLEINGLKLKTRLLIMKNFLKIK